jgi:hypothetical protein
MKNRQVLARLGLVLACMFSVVYFWVLNHRLTEAPARSDFQGAVDVLFEGSGLDGPSIRSHLTISHSLEATMHTRLQVELTVCGGQSSIEGVLVFSGDARLSSPVQLGGIGDLKPAPLEVVHSLSTVGQELTGVPLELLRFQLDDIPSCVTPEEGQGPVPLGTGIIVGGRAQSPVVEKAGARYWIAPPQVGAIPGVSSNQLGVFHFDGPSPSYYRDIDRSNEVRYEMSDRFSRDFVRPDPVGQAESSASLEWQAKKASIVAHAMVVDLDEQQTTQNLLVFWSIMFGISGSLLATMIWELLFKGTQDAASVKGDGLAVTGDEAAPGDDDDRRSEGATDKATLRYAPIVAIALGLKLLIRHIERTGRRSSDYS